MVSLPFKKSKMKLIVISCCFHFHLPSQIATFGPIDLIVPIDPQSFPVLPIPPLPSSPLTIPNHISPFPFSLRTLWLGCSRPQIPSWTYRCYHQHGKFSMCRHLKWVLQISQTATPPVCSPRNEEEVIPLCRLGVRPLGARKAGFSFCSSATSCKKYEKRIINSGLERKSPPAWVNRFLLPNK